eukprot:scaffold15837_cov49-Cyclotella_meneghiniana.AAC.4
MSNASCDTIDLLIINDDLFRQPFRVCLGSLQRNNEGRSESELVSQLEAILKANPDVAVETSRPPGPVLTLLHHAARLRSPEFCRLLIDVNPNLVRTANNRGTLPFHIACLGSNVETAKYLYHRYPESINIRPENRRGNYLLHWLGLARFHNSSRNEENRIELTQFLLKHDQGEVSSPNVKGELPLHCVCVKSNLEIVKLIFNQYPQAIHIRTNTALTPLDVAARNEMRHELTRFFEHQLELEHQAHEDRTPDNRGRLPIHRAVQNRETEVGAIKLMVAANPASIGITDSHGCTLLHLACQGGNLDTINYLMGIMDRDSLKVTDFDGNLPLHHACMRGNCDLIPHIIEQSTFGVTLQNSDNQIPLQLLLFESESDRDSLEYVEAVRCLFQVNPVDTLKCLTGKDKEHDDSKKRKRVG